MSDPNDLQAFLSEAWSHLEQGVDDSGSPARFPTFATVSADGAPEARTVALRGALRETATLEVHTDIATPKVDALKHAPIAAFHFWVPDADFQIRATANVEVLTGPSIDAQWQRIPPAARVSYGTSPTPGTPIRNVYAYEKPAERDRFAVLRCTLNAMDLVHLGRRHRRAAFVRGDDWTGAWLAP